MPNCPREVGHNTYQAKSSCLCYNYYITNKYKEKLGILSLIKHQRNKNSENIEVDTPEDVCTSEHVIPNSVMHIDCSRKEDFFFFSCQKIM